MPRHRHHLLALVSLAAATACAGAPPAGPLAVVTWPAPPAAAQLRLAATWTDATLRPPRQGRLRRLAGLLVGEAPEQATAGLLVRPFGVAVDGGGVTFVADPDAQAVLRIAPGGEVERLGCRDLAWGAPMAVAVAPEATLLVADAGRGEVLRLGPGDTCTRLAPGAFERPTALLLLPDRLLVADPARQAVLSVPLGGGPATPWGQVAEHTPLHFPVALAAAGDGSVLLVDAMNFRVVRLAGDGRWLGAFAAPDEQGGLRRPKGIAVDAAGRVYVSDAERDQVLRFSPAGTFEVALGAPGGQPGWFSAPAGLAVAGGHLLVADSQNRRIQVFEILGERS